MQQKRRQAENPGCTAARRSFVSLDSRQKWKQRARRGGGGGRGERRVSVQVSRAKSHKSPAEQRRLRARALHKGKGCIGHTVWFRYDVTASATLFRYKSGKIRSLSFSHIYFAFHSQARVLRSLLSPTPAPLCLYCAVTKAQIASTVDHIFLNFFSQHCQFFFLIFGKKEET